MRQNLPQVSYYHEITPWRVYAFIVQTNFLGTAIDKVVSCGGFVKPIALLWELKSLLELRRANN